MDRRSQFAFLALILTQAAHSAEEYAFRLYDVFAPARFLSSLVSNDLAIGFAVLNAALVTFGFWCYMTRVRPRHSSAEGWVWFWVLLESVNGLGHLVFALSRGTYFPGVITAPVLLVLSIYLAWRLSHSQPQGRAAV